MSNRPNQQIKPHPTRLHHPLITYLSTHVRTKTSGSLSSNQSCYLLSNNDWNTTFFYTTKVLVKATTQPTLPTCYYVDCRAMAMYLVVVRPRIWASELRCAAAYGTAGQTSTVRLVVFKKVNYFKCLLN